MWLGSETTHYFWSELWWKHWVEACGASTWYESGQTSSILVGLGWCGTEWEGSGKGVEGTREWKVMGREWEGSGRESGKGVGRQ